MAFFKKMLSLNIQKMKKPIAICFFFVSIILMLNARQSRPCWFDTCPRHYRPVIQKAENIIFEIVKCPFDAFCTSHNIRAILVLVHDIRNGRVKNITEPQIQSQIDAVNEDFKKMAETNGDDIKVDTEIELGLSIISLDEQCAQGIVIVLSKLSNHLDPQRFMLKT